MFSPVLVMHSNIDLVEAVLVGTAICGSSFNSFISSWLGIDTSLIDVVALSANICAISHWVILITAVASFNWVVAGVHEEVTTGSVQVLSQDFAVISLLEE